jgi:uracil-DNA glycosylase
VIQVSVQAKILIVGQAPGSKVHETGVPFDDPSGERLRQWMGIDASVFYNPKKIAIVPMGFCYPGTGKSGDLPPRPECAVKWRSKLLGELTNVRLTLVIGKYAQDYHLPSASPSLTETVSQWRSYWPSIVPLPHPSPRNNIWISNNPWFAADLLPMLKDLVREVLQER